MIKSSLHTTAQQYLDARRIRFLPIVEVAQMTNTPETTIRTWIERGYPWSLSIEHRRAKWSGESTKGKKALFSFDHVVEILTVKSLTSANVAPKALLPQSPETDISLPVPSVLSGVITQIRAIVYPDETIEQGNGIMIQEGKKTGKDRYLREYKFCVLYYDSKQGLFQSCLSTSPLNIQNNGGYVVISIDCYRIAMDVLELFEKFKHYM